MYILFINYAFITLLILYNDFRGQTFLDIPRPTVFWYQSNNVNNTHKRTY